MTEKRQTSQGYIIRILQYFATKLDLSRSKFHSKGERSIRKVMAGKRNKKNRAKGESKEKQAKVLLSTHT